MLCVCVPQCLRSSSSSIRVVQLFSRVNFLLATFYLSLPEKKIPKNHRQRCILHNSQQQQNYWLCVVHSVKYYSRRDNVRVFFIDTNCNNNHNNNIHNNNEYINHRTRMLLRISGLAAAAYPQIYAILTGTEQNGHYSSRTQTRCASLT